MDTNIITSIEQLQNSIEELDRDYKAAVLNNTDFDTLNAMSKKLREWKSELTELELRLLDMLPSKHK